MQQVNAALGKMTQGGKHDAGMEADDPQIIPEMLAFSAGGDFQSPG
jgi:hypothetical protein